MTNGNEPIIKDENYGNVGAQGLTKREYFAAMAMQGLIASCDWSVSPISHNQINSTALYAVEHADALINALNKESGETHA